MTDPASPSIAEAVAQIRDQLAAGTPCIMLRADICLVKLTILNMLLGEQILSSPGRSVKRSIAELDDLLGDLERADGLAFIYDPVAEVSGGRSSVVRVVTTSVTPSADSADLWSSAVGSLSARPLVLLDPGGRSPPDAGDAVMVAPESHAASSCLTFYEFVFARLRQELLRLVSRMRIVLRLRLLCLLSGLSGIPDAISFVLLLLAVARCYGHRTEPSDYALPVFTSMSIVIGESAHLC